MDLGNVAITLEFTPNPNTLKFVVNRPLLERGTANFPTAETATSSPLALALYGVPGISGVMLGGNFVTITKSPDGDWDVVAEQVPQAIEKHIKEGLPIVDASWLAQRSQSNAGNTDVERKICEILDADIRPAVAMDGGDITFDRFEDGVLYLNLQGSCSSCPSSTATLRLGVEARLKELVPEVREVVAVA